MAQRTHVLTGAPGTGKTVTALEFLYNGIEKGERAVILTHDDPDDLIAEGKFLGMDLEKALLSEQLVLLRFQLDFSRRFSRATGPEAAFDELKRLLGDQKPTRVVIDSIAPFLEAGAASGVAITSLMAFLDQVGATSVVTYPADLAGMYDRRLEPLLQRAAAVLHFSADQDRCCRIELRKVRYEVTSTAPISFTMQPGVGITALADTAKQRRSNDRVTQPAEGARRLLVLDPHDALEPEVQSALRESFDVTVRSAVTSAFADLSSGTSAVLVTVRRDTVNDVLTLVRELRRSGSNAAVLLVSPFTLRSDDRARALRAGADEFLDSTMHPRELQVRVEHAIERGHRSGAIAEVEVPVVTQPIGANDSHVAMDGHAFRNAVAAHMSGDRAAFFTIVRLTPSRAGAAHALADQALRAVRVDGGDLVGELAMGAVVYLHSARRKDVGPFVERVRDEWRRGGNGELDIAMATYPAEEAQVSALLDARPTRAVKPNLELLRGAERPQGGEQRPQA